jgi:hypothetical protein
VAGWMLRVENDVFVLYDSRDRFLAANQALATNLSPKGTAQRAHLRLADYVHVIARISGASNVLSGKATFQPTSARNANDLPWSWGRPSLSVAPSCRTDGFRRGEIVVVSASETASGYPVIQEP